MLLDTTGYTGYHLTIWLDTTGYYWALLDTIGHLLDTTGYHLTLDYSDETFPDDEEEELLVWDGFKCHLAEEVGQVSDVAVDEIVAFKEASGRAKLIIYILGTFTH